MSNSFGQPSFNIGGNGNDAFHRYKMPAINLVIENKLGGTSVITNIDEISSSIRRTSGDLRSYFAKQLSCTVRIIKNKGLVFVGERDIRELQSILQSYVDKYVLCRSCQNPETHLNPHKKKIFIVCGACGHQELLK